MFHDPAGIARWRPLARDGVEGDSACFLDAGFDVVYYGNAAASAEDSSVVIDRVGALGVARGRRQPRHRPRA